MKSLNHFRSKKWISLLTTGLFTSLLLAACARSGPVSASTNVTILYKIKSSQDSNSYVQHTLQLTANSGNPDDFNNASTKKVLVKQANNQAAYVDYANLARDSQEKAEADFFYPFVEAAFKYQLNAIHARASLLRSYYSYLQNPAKTVRLSDAAQIAQYFTNPSSTESNNGASSSSGSSNSTALVKNYFDDFQFAFFYANLLRQGNGFGASPFAIDFGLRSVVFDFGTLDNVTLTNEATGTGANSQKYYWFKYNNSKTSGATSSNTVTNDTNSLGTKSFSLTNSNSQTSNLLKIKFRSYYHYGFASNSTVDDAVFKNYFQAQGNGTLLPSVFQTLSHQDFQVGFNTASMVSPLVDNNRIAGVYPDAIAWSSLVGQDKLLDNSIVSLTKILNTNNGSNVNDVSNNYSYFDHYINRLNYFPNNLAISRYADKGGVFAKNSNNLNVDWKQIKQIKTSDLLFSLFADFNLNNDYNGISKVVASSTNNTNSSLNSKWLSFENDAKLIEALTKTTTSTTSNN